MACLIAMSSSWESFNLCLFSPLMKDEVWGVSLSLFLVKSSFCGVWRTEVSTLVSVLGGTSVWGCCSVETGRSVPFSCCKGCYSLDCDCSCCCPNSCYSISSCCCNKVSTCSSVNTGGCSTCLPLSLLAAWVVCLVVCCCAAEVVVAAPICFL